MTRYAFTGPPKLSDAERELARSVVDGLDSPSEVTTGGCRGWDMAVAFAALERWPDALHRICYPADAKHDADGIRAWSARAAELGVRHVVLVPVRGDDRHVYRRRNGLLVSWGDRLVAAVHSNSFYRSGEWMTVNIARCADVPVELVDLNDVAEFS